MEDIEEGIANFANRHGVGQLEKVILPQDEYERFGLALKSRYPHVGFEPEDMNGRIFVQKDGN